MRVKLSTAFLSTANISVDKFADYTESVFIGILGADDTYKLIKGMSRGDGSWAKQSLILHFIIPTQMKKLQNT